MTRSRLAAGKPGDAALALDGRLASWQFTRAPTGVKEIGSVQFGQQEGVPAALLAGGYIEFSDSESVAPKHSFTLEAWIWPDPNQQTDARIFDKWNPEKEEGFFFDVQGRDHKLRLRTGREVSIVNQPVAPGTWNHVAATYDPVGGRRIYLNGKLACLPEGGGALVSIIKVVEGSSVANAFHSYGPNGFQISVKLDTKGGDKMFDVTDQHKGEPMAIIVDKQIVSVATIRDRFGSDFVITGKFSREEAESLATFLKNPLSHPIRIISETYVKPARSGKPR